VKQVATAVVAIAALALIALPSAAAAADFVDDGDPSVQYTGSWNSYVNSPTFTYFGGTGRLSVATSPHASVTVQWSGGRAQVIGSTEHNGQVRGLADVTVDGQSAGEADYVTAGNQSKQVVFDTGPLAAGDHTLTITARGEAADGGEGIRISFDALVHGDCLDAGLADCDPPGLRGDDMTDQDFFAALDLQRPGLAAVKSAVDQGDYVAARSALVSYFRTQPNRAQGLDGAQRPAPEPTYDTVIAEDLRQGKIYSGGELGGTWNGVRLAHWYELANAYWWTGGQPYAQKLGTWLGNLVESRKVRQLNGLTISLGSHPLSHSVWALQDASLADFSVKQRIDALKALLVSGRELKARLDDPALDPGMWSSPNQVVIAANALAKLGLTFPEFAAAGPWTAKGFAEVEESVENHLFPDGAGVEMSTGYSASPLGTAVGLLDLAERLGVAGPSDLDMDRLTQAGWYWAYLLHPDGVQPMLGDGDATKISEQALGGGTTYVDGGSITFQGALPAAYEAAVEGAPPGWYTRGLSRPDLVRRTSEVVGVPSMAAAVDGDPANLLPTSRAFPFTAQYFQRSGFTEDARYLAFDAGPIGTFHGHQDKLSFDMYAYGRPLIADPGRFTYGEPWQTWFKSAAAHNTISVNGQLQHTPKPEVPTQPQTQTTWTSDATFDDATGVYDLGYGKERAVKAVHRREVFFAKPSYWIVTDRVSGLASATTRSMLHFTPGTATADPSTKAVTFVADDVDGDTAGVVAAPAGHAWTAVDTSSGLGAPTLDPSDASLHGVRGWYAPIYGAKYPAPQAMFTRGGSLPTVTATVIYPFAGASAPSVSTTTLTIERTNGAPGAADEAIAIDVARPGGADLFVSAPSDRVDRTFGGAGAGSSGRTDAARVFVARDGAGNVKRFVILSGRAVQLGAAALIEAPADVGRLSGVFNGSTLELRGADVPSGLRIAAPATVTRVTLNGTAVTATRDGGQLVIQP
jgi:hypothetical protein